MLVFYIAYNPKTGYVTYAFGVWLYKCSFRGRSLIKGEITDDLALIMIIIPVGYRE